MSIKKSNRFGWGPDCVIPDIRLEFLKSLVSGKKIIDIGCGRGGGFGILSNGEQGQKIYMALIYLKKEL